jgi:hypothetical protein
MRHMHVLARACHDGRFNCHRHLWANLKSSCESESKANEHENLLHGGSLFYGLELGRCVRCTTDFAAVQLRGMGMGWLGIALVGLAQVRMSRPAW